jgi:hypothetical protein
MYYFGVELLLAVRLVEFFDWEELEEEDTY